MKTTAINDAAATSEQVREPSRRPAREMTEDELACVSGGSMSNILNMKHQIAMSTIQNIR
jgi:bacteriocin-like protein